MANFDGTDDYFDSREVIERIAELEATEVIDREPEDQDELDALYALQEEAEGYISDWEYGERSFRKITLQITHRSFARMWGISPPNFRRGLRITSTGKPLPKKSRSITRYSSSAERPTTRARSLLSSSPDVYGLVGRAGGI